MKRRIVNTSTNMPPAMCHTKISSFFGSVFGIFASTKKPRHRRLMIISASNQCSATSTGW